MKADTHRPGARPRKAPEQLQPCLAGGRPAAAAQSRAEAEDLAALVEVDFTEIPAVVDMLKARSPGSALVHEHWGDNVFLETSVDIGGADTYAGNGNYDPQNALYKKCVSVFGSSMPIALHECGPITDPTLLMTTGDFVTMPSILPPLSFNPDKELIPITMLAIAPSILKR